jgi:hypothetical protein
VARTTSPVELKASPSVYVVFVGGLLTAMETRAACIGMTVMVKEVVWPSYVTVTVFVPVSAVMAVLPFVRAALFHLSV